MHWASDGKRVTDPAREQLDDDYMGTLSGLTKYGTMNTPSLKTNRERRGKARAGKVRPRTRSTAHTSDVKVYHVDDPTNAVTVPASAYARKRRIVRKSPNSDEARAWQQAQRDWRAQLRARVAGNEQAL
jgi:hypothetical protein